THGDTTMPRTAKTTDKPARKPRAKKAAEPAAEQVVRSPEEQQLVDRYPHQNIKPGSWRPANSPDRPTCGHKRSVITICKACEAERVVMTSDLQWQTTAYCTQHAEIVRSNKAAKKPTTESKE